MSKSGKVIALASKLTLKRKCRGNRNYPLTLIFSDWSMLVDAYHGQPVCSYPYKQKIECGRDYASANKMV